jgi:hypothetical protein
MFGKQTPKIIMPNNPVSNTNTNKMYLLVMENQKNTVLTASTVQHSIANWPNQATNKHGRSF